MYRKITPGEAIRLLDAGKARAVDVREPDEYAAEHIPGAVLLPLSDISAASAQAAMPEKDAEWLVYCRTGRRSREAMAKLEAMGYTRLHDLGGILGWPYELESL